MEISSVQKLEDRMRQDAHKSGERPYFSDKSGSFFRPFETLFACLAFATALLVYIFSLAPNITFGDSGELITAAVRLGVAHPPGYPLWLLIGKAFSLLPIRNVAYRLNLMSALFNAAAVGLLALIIVKTIPKVTAKVMPKEVFDSPIVGLMTGSASATAALALGFSPTFWQQSVAAEVYAFHNFLICLILMFILLWSEAPQKNGLLFLIAFVFGAGLGNHQTLALMIPATGLYVVLVRPKAVISPRALVGSLLFFLLGCLLYLYLPISASTHPPLNWGNPVTWDSFWFHVLRKQYRSLDIIRPLSVIAGQIKFFFSATAKESLPLVLLVPALLIVGLASKEGRKWVVFTLCAFICTGILFVVIANTELDLNVQELLRIYFLPAWLFVAMWVGYGIGTINLLALRASRGLRRRPLMAALLAVLWLILPMSGLAMNYRDASLRGHNFGRQYGDRLLNGIPEDGILFAGTDSAYAIPMYMKWVQARRPDVSIFSINRLSDMSYRAEAARNTVNLKFLSDDDYAEAFALYAKAPGAENVSGAHDVGRVNAFLLLKLFRNWAPQRPIYYDQGLPIDWITDYAIPSGLLMELRPERVDALGPDVVAQDREYWQELEESLLANKNFLHDSAARQKFSKCRSNIGYLYLRRKMYLEAAEALEQATRFSDRNIEAYAFLALVYKEQGKQDKAVGTFDEYLRRDTWNTSARAFAESLAR
jgi:tetratricopeptide (TPR) repeat protein